jgi:outer membrane murein-binding lipoprotein Lpp
MICSSVKRFGFMSIPQWMMDSTHFWRRFRGSGQRGRRRLVSQLIFLMTYGVAITSRGRFSPFGPLDIPGRLLLGGGQNTVGRPWGEPFLKVRTRSSEWPILSFYALENVIREQVMRLLFSGRNAKLKTMNRILTDAARKRTERIEELERQVAQLERQVAQLKQELEPARKAIERARELEAVAAQRAHFLNEKDEELAALREALTKRSLRIQELEHTLAEIDQR